MGPDCSVEAADTLVARRPALRATASTVTRRPTEGVPERTVLASTWTGTPRTSPGATGGYFAEGTLQCNAMFGIGIHRFGQVFDFAGKECAIVAQDSGNLDPLALAGQGVGIGAGVNGQVYSADLPLARIGIAALKHAPKDGAGGGVADALIVFDTAGQQGAVLAQLSLHQHVVAHRHPGSHDGVDVDRDLGGRENQVGVFGVNALEDSPDDGDVGRLLGRVSGLLGAHGQG